MGMLLRRYHGAPRVGQPEAAAPEDMVAPEVVAPKKGDNAAAWKDYARLRGWDESATKAAIVEKYEAEVAKHSDEGDERVVSTPTGATVEEVPEGVVTASEPAPTGEAEQRDSDAVGEGVTTAADLTGDTPEGDAPEGDTESTD